MDFDMFKDFDVNDVKDTVKENAGKAIDTVKAGAGKAVDTFDAAKGIVVKSKCDFAFRVKSAKQKKDLVNFSFDFDKEWPLLKIAGVILGAVALMLAVSAFLDGLFGTRSDD